MRVTSLQLRNFRSVAAMEPIALDSINVLIGPNNVGKSTLIRALYLLQQGLPDPRPDIRLGATEATVVLDVEDVHGISAWNDQPGNCDSGKLTATIHTSRADVQLNLAYSHPSGDAQATVSQLPAAEPNHFVVPYLTKRKAMNYTEDVREQFALQVTPDFSYLAAKLSRLGNPSFPAHERYRKTCEEMLGFVVTAVPSPNGQRPGVYVTATETLPIEQMGEGVPNIVGMLANLALSEKKLFLIEEPENDLHPAALKALLNLIIDSATTNQFVISTHSNIVARYLGAANNSQLYYIKSRSGELPPEAQVNLVPSSPAARLGVLRELGYSFADFDLWDGWLILEESSAERVIRDYLIPFFAPKLSRIRTLAAGGNSQVEPTFEDFHRLARFTHLEEAYRGRAWVLVDGDDAGQEIVARLRARYSSWDASHFACFDQEQFETYYPVEFSERVKIALGEEDRQTRRDAKRTLLDDVRRWLDEDEARAHAALETSAAPVIDALRRIETSL